MFIFRLISFSLRAMAAFALVLLLQIRFDGKTLEQRLVSFGKRWTGTRILNQLGEDGVAAVRGGPKKSAARPPQAPGGAPMPPEEAVRQLSSVIRPAAEILMKQAQGWLEAVEEGAPEKVFPPPGAAPPPADSAAAPQPFAPAPFPEAAPPAAAP